MTLLKVLTTRVALALVVFVSALSAASQVWAQSPYSTSLDEDTTITLLALVWLIALLVYFIPTFVAFHRRHPNRWAILVVNFAFGATGFGWLGSLVWACNAVHRSTNGSNGGESGLNLFVNDPVKLELASPLPTPSAPRHEASAIIDQLAQVERLREGGAITIQEHAALRAGLLNSLAPPPV